jgi:hypothetical protein
MDISSWKSVQEFLAANYQIAFLEVVVSWCTQEYAFRSISMCADPVWLTGAILRVSVGRTRSIHMYFLPPSVQRLLTNHALLGIIQLKLQC